jgi:hypothetical protein
MKIEKNQPDAVKATRETKSVSRRVILAAERTAKAATEGLERVAKSKELYNEAPVRQKVARASAGNTASTKHAGNNVLNKHGH